ncbi:MAG TPA: hypothetical protein VNO34_04745 [Actinomycetota bacterium]|nr:hypothetical protein [Actinomycetota bacterium]
MRPRFALRGPARLSALVVVAGLVLGACSSTYTYVKNPQARTFFKVPNDWRVFSEEEIFARDIEGLSPQGEAATREAIWMVAFDASPHPSLDHLFEADAQAPHGFARVQPISDQARDTFSLATLRNILFPIDRVAQEDPGAVEILQNQDLVLDNGFHGSRIVFNIRRGTTFYTVNQTALVDPATRTLYLFVVGCEARCYVANQDVIEDVVQSWTVEER